MDNTVIVDVGNMSDGYHTFNELYAHRVALFIALANKHRESWKSLTQSDGEKYDGWFIAGIGLEKGKQISYHIPLDKWDLLHCVTLEKAPDFDGHTSEDVVKRLLEMDR